MALTNSDRFTYIYLQWSGFEQRIASVYWQTDETPPESETIGTADTVETGQEADLAILQEIYASSEGFRNADGDSITAVVDQLPGITNADDLEPNGFPNPLIAGFQDRVPIVRKSAALSSCTPK